MPRKLALIRTLAGLPLFLTLFFSGLYAQAPTAVAISGRTSNNADSNVVSVGESYTLTAFVTGGAEPFTYEWKKGGATISGASASVYVINPVSADSAGSYSVTAINGSGSATSSAFNLNVRGPAPVISVHPAPQTLQAGGTISLSATALGSPPFYFNWYRGGTLLTSNLVFSNSNTFTKVNAQPTDAGSYSVRVRYGSPSEEVISDSATVTVTTLPPVITQQPVSKTAVYLNSVILSVSADGGGSTLQYRWFKDGVLVLTIPNLSTSTNLNSPNLSIGVMQPEYVGVYTVSVSNSAGQSVASMPVNLAVTSGVTFATQPSSQTVTTGSAATFSVATTYVDPFPGRPSYQWRKNGVDIPGASSATFSIPSVQTLDAGSYAVFAYFAGTTPYLGVLSETATLTIDSPATAPTLTSQPVAQSVSSGFPATFTVVATGNPVPSYQWRKNGNSISGATSSTFAIPFAQTTDQGEYSVVVSNSAGSVVSVAVTLSVTPLLVAPTIVLQPTSRTVASGTPVAFQVTASGTPTPTYQWRKDGTPISGAINSTYNLSSAQAADAGSYTAVVTNSLGSVTSNPATLTVNSGTGVFGTPSITNQPVAVTIAAGSTATFSASVNLNGAPEMLYYWVKNGFPLSARISSSASTITLSLPNVQTADAADYALDVITPGGAVRSAGARLALLQAPQIVTQPENLTASQGSFRNLIVNVSGEPAPTLQWYKNNVPVPGATSNILPLSNIQLIDAGDYTVVATNSAGAITSQIGRLTVLYGPNLVSVTNQSVSVAPGGSTSLSVNVAGTSPLVYEWSKGGILIPGQTSATLNLSNLQPSDAGTYRVGVSNSSGALTVFFQLSVGSSSSTVPVSIIQQPVAQSAALGSTVNFFVGATGTPAPSYQWRKNGTSISGATSSTLTLSNLSASDAASYSVVVTNTTGSVTSDSVALTLMSSTPYAGTYFGKLGPGGTSGDFAGTIKSDGTGVMLLHLSSSQTAIIVTDFKVNGDGSFSVNGSVLTSASTPERVSASASKNPASSNAGVITGSLNPANGTLSGMIGGYNLSLSGTKITASTSAASAGFYQAPAVNGANGAVYALVAPDGRALIVAQTDSSIEGGVGTAIAANSSVSITVTTASGVTVTTTVNSSTGAITASADKGPLASTVFSGLRDDVRRTDRLVNISSRSNVTASELMIAGFVITGTAPKKVLIRATGPALAELGVGGTIANPKLELYRGSEKIETNDDWFLAANADEVIAVSARTGAFPLPERSRDAVLLTTLNSGGYTALVSSVSGVSGIALVEVYDADVSPDIPTAPRLINISTRARVTNGDGLLIAGIVVTGNAPKKILIRAIGPGLAAYGVSGVLTDPLLKLYRGNSVIRQNDNWSDSPSEASLISAAGAATGAFTLVDGAKDAAMLVTLEAGSYTAQVSGVDAATGAALIEVYEVP